MNKLMMVLVMMLVCICSYAEDVGVTVEGLAFNDMKISTDVRGKTIMLSHSEGETAYKIADFPAISLVMKDGSVIEKGKISEITPVDVTVMFKRGIKTLKFEGMNEACQKFFSYDKDAAAVYIAESAERQSVAQAAAVARLKAAAEVKAKADAAARAAGQGDTAASGGDGVSTTGSGQQKEKVYEQKEVKYHERCAHCQGTGKVSTFNCVKKINYMRKCDSCNGRGYNEDKRYIEVEKK